MDKETRKRIDERNQEEATIKRRLALRKVLGKIMGNPWPYLAKQMDEDQTAKAYNAMMTRQRTAKLKLETAKRLGVGSWVVSLCLDELVELMYEADAINKNGTKFSAATAIHHRQMCIPEGGVQ